MMSTFLYAISINPDVVQMFRRHPYSATLKYIPGRPIILYNVTFTSRIRVTRYNIAVMFDAVNMLQTEL